MTKEKNIKNRVRNNTTLGIILVLSVIFSTVGGIYTTFELKQEVNALESEYHILVRENADLRKEVSEIKKDLKWIEKEHDILVETGMFPPHTK